MKLLVTGGAGFIGSHTVDQLVAHDHALVVLDNLDPQVHGDGAREAANLADHVAAQRIEFIRGDARDQQAVAAALRGDIRHCVGDPTRTCEVLGFRATTSFRAGVDELMAWSERHQAMDRVKPSFEELERQGLVR